MKPINPMTRRGGPVLLWLVATAAAIAVASAAIAQVGRDVTQDPPSDARLAQATASRATPVQPPAGAPPAPTEPAVRTYDVVGGRAAVAVAEGTVDVRWATPREGFRASSERAADGSELRVEFRSDSHRSRINVGVQDGLVFDEVEEDDRR